MMYDALCTIWYVWYMSRIVMYHVCGMVYRVYDMAYVLF